MHRFINELFSHSQSMPKIILTTGGTGGHIFPALAVAEALKETFASLELLFIGANYGLEQKLVTQASINFVGLNVQGVLGKGLRSPRAFLKLLKSVPQAIKIIRKFNPNCIIGFGNYASFSTIIAAGLLKIPVVIHEQNAIPGVTNKICSFFAQKICVSLPHTSGFNQKKCVLTGNPIRQDINRESCVNNKKFESKRLLILGGSLGATALNSYICKILPQLVRSKVEIIHQTGKNDWENVVNTYIKYGYYKENVFPFISSMGKAYEWADLILCRAGASTVAEICAAGVPAIFVPFPAAIHDHQTKNASLVEKAGGAVVIPEKEINAVESVILNFFANPGKLAEMSKKLLKLAQPEAAVNVVKVIKNVMN